MMKITSFLISTLVLFSLFLSSCRALDSEDIKHVVVIYLENWSFDGLFGFFPGANGIKNAIQEGLPLQADQKGNPYKVLPQDQPTHTIPNNLPNLPFSLAKYVNSSTSSVDLTHRYYQEQYQINNGRMDRFVAWSSASGVAYSYYDATNMYIGRLASNYTLLDRLHHSAFGGSFLNHQWLVSGRTPYYPKAPYGAYSRLDINGILTYDSVLRPDGYAVNTMFSVNPPLYRGRNENDTLPSIKNTTTIGDLLTEAGVSWAWYSGGYNDAMRGHPDEEFQFHHQPFTYYEQYAANTEARKIHLKDEEDYFRVLKNGTLESVVFVKPLGEFNMHPGESTLDASNAKLQSYIEALQNSSYWDSSVVIIVFDENGGRWDHVAPPKVDEWGPGTRIPALLVGPFAPKKKIDSTLLETLSVTKYIETHFGLTKTIIPPNRKVNNIADLLINPNTTKNHLKKIIIISGSVVLGAFMIVVGAIYLIRRNQREEYEFSRL